MTTIGILLTSIVVGIVDTCSTNDFVMAPRVYAEAVAKAGHVPLIIPRVDDASTLAAQLKLADLVLFCGGEDVAPDRYGMEKSPRCERINHVRDAFEWRVLDECVKARRPVFGICRGVQLINCYFGGTLYQDIYTEIDGVERHRGENQ